MIMTMVVIKKFTYCMSMFATKTITKFLKNQFKKDNIYCFLKMFKKYENSVCTFPLKKIDSFSLFSLLNLSVKTALPHKKISK